PTTPYADWAVTVAFYTVVHAVEAFLARQGVHSRTHTERRSHVRRSFPHIWTLYYRLDTFSRQARYEGIHPSPRLLRQLVDHDLTTILNSLGVEL
ncbi:MAG: hypothetical protein ACK40X_12215, partial [Armatimonadota bacterium]